ncbi:Flp family type IVb pilin [Variovorax sp. EBFNA2]|uniref:Flp family type IVb pilin n=1 Tax=Variovorax sp. EBFNA2 TaxID=3342097 RepID=UPI0029C0CC68|nr:Flp family type IVb pilin [Variovorax boronicumulans]WPG40802.1 Flp family type IVb pilin [Variovorax boronicumulans]
MLSSITRFLRDEEGATAIEYGLIAGLVSIAIAATLGTLGTDLSALFGKISAKINPPTTPPV